MVVVDEYNSLPVTGMSFLAMIDMDEWSNLCLDIR